MAQLSRMQPLLIDELGYLTIKPEQANAFFRLMDQRYTPTPGEAENCLPIVATWILRLA